MACEYCEDGKNLFDRGPEHARIVFRNELNIALYAYDWVTATIEVNYCPMCGERIGDDHGA